MGQCELKDFFDGTWGIVAHRREEIEQGGSGTFDRVLNEEINAHFVDSFGAGELLEVSPGYASKLLIDADAKYIIHDNARAFYRVDVGKLVCERIEAEAKAEQARKEKAQAKEAKKALKNNRGGASENAE